MYYRFFRKWATIPPNQTITYPLISLERWLFDPRQTSHLSWQASLFPRSWPAPWSGSCFRRRSSEVTLKHVLSVQCAVPFKPVHSSEMEALEVTLGLGDRRLFSSMVSVLGFTLKRGMFGILHPTAQSRSSKPNKPQTICCCLVYCPQNFPTCSSNLVMSISSDCATS